MMRYFLAMTLLCSISISTIGCGSPRSPRPKAKESVTAKWTEGAEFFGQPQISGLQAAYERNSWKEGIAVLKSADLKTALDKLEASELPKGYESKQSSKDTVVTKFKAMIEEANGGANKKTLKSLFDEMIVAQKELLKTE